jgi:cytochrome c2
MPHMNRQLCILLVAVLAVACGKKEVPAAAPPTPAAAAANAEHGRALITQYGCTMCHIVPGAGGPRGMLGPSLEGLASRPVISLGTVQNTPQNLARFIENPQSLNPQSSMPPAGVTPEDARDITAFLLTLK